MRSRSGDDSPEIVATACRRASPRACWDELIINTHVYGILAAYTPCLRIRRIDGAYFNTYLESFERVWASARPFDGEPARRT